MQEAGWKNVVRAPGVSVYGDVRLAEWVSLWPNAVIRCECLFVEVGRMTNIQDGALVHVGFDHVARIGEFCSITHRAIVHGATVEDHCLVGVGAVIMDGARVGRGSIVAGGALIPEGKEFPPHSIIAGLPARQVGERDSAAENRLNAWVYHRNARAYLRGDHRAWEGPEFRAWRERMRLLIAGDRDLALDPARALEEESLRGSKLA